MTILIYKYLIYVLVFVVTEAKINMNITVASTKGGVKVTFNGADLKLVSEKEVKLYNITDHNLKKGVKVRLGKEPDEIFLRDPTDYGNIFYKHGWGPIKRNVHVKSVKIESIKNEKVVLTVRNSINNSTKKAKVGVNLQETVETTITTFWDKNGFQDNIYYNISIHYLKTKLRFDKNKWMDNNVKTIKSTFGSNSLGFVNVAPGTKIITKLTAKKTILLFNVIYSASLVGNLVTNYVRLFGKHHFWAPTIANVMQASNLRNEFIINETIEVKCYTDPFIEVINSITGKNMPIMFVNKPFRVRKRKN